MPMFRPLVEELFLRLPLTSAKYKLFLMAIHFPANMFVTLDINKVIEFIFEDLIVIGYTNTEGQNFYKCG